MANPPKPAAKSETKPATELYAVDPYGRRVRIAQDDAARAVEQGYKITTAEEAAQAKREAKFGSAGQVALTAVEGAGSGLSFGGTDYLASELLGDDYRQNALARSEVNPWARTGGEIAGALAPLLLTDGASAAATAGETGSLGMRAARLLGGAPRTVAKLGAGAERGVASLAGTETMGARLLAKAAGAAVEGAAYEGGHEVSQSALRDEPLTGEKLVAALGRGAIMGAGFGVGGALLGEGKSAIVRALQRGERGGVGVESRAAQLAETAGAARAEAGGLSSITDDLAVSGGGGKAKIELTLPEQAYAAARGGDTGEVLQLMRGEKTAKMLTQDLDTASQRLAREGKAAYDKGEDALLAIDDIVRGEGKAKQMAGLVNEANVATIKTEAKATVDALRSSIDDMAAKAETGQYKGSNVGKMRSELDKFAKGIEQAETASDTFMAVDRLKRQWGKYSGGKGAEAYAAQEQYMTILRPHLEAPELYGAAADAQRAINEPWSRLIKSGKVAGKQLEYDTGRAAPGLGFDNLYRADAEKLRGVLSNVGSTAADAPMQVLKDHAAARADFLEAVASNYKLNAAQSKAVNEARAAAKEWDRVLTDAAEEVRITKLGQREAQRGGGIASKIAGAVPGVGPTLSAILDLNPISITKKTQAVTSLAARADAMFGTRIAQWIGASTKAGGKGGALGMLGGKTTPRLPGGPSARAALPAAMIGTRAQDLVEHRRASLGKLESDPDHAAATYAKALGDLPEVAPKTASAVLATLQRGNQFLLSKLPAPRAQGNQLTPQFGQQPVSRIEAERYARYDRAVHEPATVLDDLARGTLTPEAVEGLRAVHPELYEEMRGVAQEACAQLKNPLPYSQRVRLSLLLDIQGDATQAPEFIMRTQATYAAAEAEAKQPAPQPMPPGSLSRGLQSDISTIEGETLL